MVENVRGNADLTIDVDAAHAQLQNGRPFVMDVRPRDEYQEAHVPGAVNMPLKELGEDHSALPSDLDAPILSVCQRGNASLSGVLFLKIARLSQCTEHHWRDPRVARKGLCHRLRIGGVMHKIACHGAEVHLTHRFGNA